MEEAELKPVVGQCFQSLDFAIAFYDVYARAVGFDTRKQGVKKVEGVTIWQYIVCTRQGKKRTEEEDMVNARHGFTLKRRRLSNRCCCPTKISLRYFSKGGRPRYKIHKFVEAHNHTMVEVQHKPFMTINRKLTEVHEKFILDCSRANIGPTLTFKFMKEMVLDEMRRKKELSDAFTYHYEVNSENQLVALFWCDGVLKRNYHMFGDIVAFDSTYNTNMYCMIFCPFTGKDNHGRPVTFAAGLVSNEKTGAFAWLFKHFIECMGVAPKMIVIDQDLGMRSAIEEILVGTRHRWCMWHIMHKLSVKAPKRLLTDEHFKKDFHACVWSELHEPEEFEEMWDAIIVEYGLENVGWFKTMYRHRKYWIPAYFRDFPLGSMIRTTSVSESENSFYKIFLKPRLNLAEFYLSFNNALESQCNSNAKLDYADSTIVPILATDQPFEKHASTLFTDSMFRRVQEEIVEGCNRCRIVDKYSESRWMKTTLAKALHGYTADVFQNTDAQYEKLILSNELTSIFFSCLASYQSNMDTLRAFVGGMRDLKSSIDTYSPPISAVEKRRMVEEFYGMVRLEVVEVHPPDVIQTKGSCSTNSKLIISKREKAIKEYNRPLRRCMNCLEMGHHDSRNCPENANGKGKEKCLMYVHEVDPELCFV
ncbi:protein FAR1-RELATED SEQUENCE 5-like [Salvia hispanica]|uniref:protein FAR1-RELATED SEQUENCE 5-like n=1 Tax=Salvia hispanica TaxID=49212 RepID=UPI002009C17A|nr:protein FAR1-RELATED SEQUENCE 5-like [Salvia hispanica]